MSPRHTAVGILRPILITFGILGIAYLIGGPGLFTPSRFLGFVVVTIVVGITVMCFFGGIYSDEHRHLHVNASVHLTSSASRHPGHADADDEPLAPSALWPVSAVPPGLPWNSGTRSDTPEKVFSFTRRVFRSQDAKRD
jgi:hypothetical protein